MQKNKQVSATPRCRPELDQIKPIDNRPYYYHHYVQVPLRNFFGGAKILGLAFEHFIQS